MSAKLGEFRSAPTRLRANESVVLLAQPHIDGSHVEASFMSCLQRRLSDGPRAGATPVSAADRALQSANNAVGTVPSAAAARPVIVPEQQFMDALYPWLEPSTAPTNREAIGKFLSRPGVRERVTSMGVRYIIWVDGSTQKIDGGGSLFCGLVAAGAGCFGFGWWQKESSYEATLWDLEGGVGAGILSTRVNGYSFLLGLIAPVPLVAPVQGTACRRLGDQLRAFLRDETYY